MKKISFVAERGVRPERLDTITSLKSSLTRSQIQKYIREGFITVNGSRVKANYKVKDGDRVELDIPDVTEGLLVPEDIPLNILWEDESIIVADKPPGMVTHPAAGNRSGTLMNALAARCEKLASAGAPLRPGVVHRLDKDTSGAIIIAKTDEAYYSLIRQFKDRRVEKRYLALLYGAIRQDHGEISAMIGRSASDRKKMSTRTKRGKEAVTRFDVMRRLGSATLVNIRILTGRTHQIRVHFSSVGHPVLGDRMYGKKVEIALRNGKRILFPRQMLHAYSLKLQHPVSGDPMEFIAPVPDDMERAIAELNG